MLQQKKIVFRSFRELFFDTGINRIFFNSVSITQKFDNSITINCSKDTQPAAKVQISKAFI